MKILLQDFAYQKCRELIQDKTLTSGKLYSEVALSKKLNISRTPLRSAIQRLEKEGVVTRLPQRGFQVKEFSLSDIKELFDARKAIEGFAAEFLALNRNDADMESLKRHLQEYEFKIKESGNSESDTAYIPFLEVDRQFHLDLINTLNNSRLMEMYDDLRQSISLIAMKRFRLVSQRNQSLNEHQAIIDAIEKKDPVAARNTMYKHLDSAMELIEKNII